MEMHLQKVRLLEVQNFSTYELAHYFGCKLEVASRSNFHSEVASRSKFASEVACNFVCRLKVASTVSNFTAEVALHSNFTSKVTLMFARRPEVAPKRAANSKLHHFGILRHYCCHTYQIKSSTPRQLMFDGDLHAVQSACRKSSR